MGYFGAIFLGSLGLGTGGGGGVESVIQGLHLLTIIILCTYPFNSGHQDMSCTHNLRTSGR